MNQIYIFALLLLICGDSFCLNTTKQTITGSRETEPEESESPPQKLYTFNVKDKPFTDLIYELAGELSKNIMLPQGAAALNTRVTYRLNEKITLQKAWDVLSMLLSFAGYTWEPKGNMLFLNKIDATIKQEPLPLFVNVALEDLPESEQVIRAIFYLSNIKVTDQAQADIIKKILQDMLSPTADIKTDIKTNGLILTDKSSYIKAAMQIISELDLGGMRDAIEVLPLYYTHASYVDELFNKYLFTAGTEGAAGAPPASVLTQASYFPRNTKVLALNRTNAIVVMGTPKSIDLVRDFIIKYIDHPIESGDSILHIYDLQYLDAQAFEPVLKGLINTAVAGQTGSQGTVAAETGSPLQEFRSVLIKAEPKTASPAIQPTQSIPGQITISAPSTGVQEGGNRIVIAARRHDWVRIKKLIEDLDKPQPQVALEVLVVDLTLIDNKILGSQMRNKASFHGEFDNNINFQTAHLGNAILTQNPGGTFPSDALMSNLLQFIDAEAKTNLANLSPIGSLVISINDPQTSGIWQVWRILNQYTNSRLLAQPFIVTTNNVQASITISDNRYLPADATVAPGGGVKQDFKYLTAALTVDLLPRISLTNNINLQITITVNQFISATFNTQTRRIIQTNSNIGNGEILALGGLIQLTDNIDVNETPLLSKIPVIGWFFKRQQKIIQKNNLMIFICPTVIQPKIQGGTNAFTDNKLVVAQDSLDEHVNFESLRDPITRWFFKPDPNFGKNVVDTYAAQEAFTPEHDHNKQRLFVKNDATKSEHIAATANNQQKADTLKRLAKNEENPLTRKKRGRRG